MDWRIGERKRVGDRLAWTAWTSSPNNRVSGAERAENGASMMGAHFRTGGAAPFFGFPISELAGEVVELDLIWKRESLGLREQRMDTTNVEGRFDLLQASLLHKAQRHREPGRGAGPPRAAGSTRARCRPIQRLSTASSRA